MVQILFLNDQNWSVLTITWLALFTYWRNILVVELGADLESVEGAYT